MPGSKADAHMVPTLCTLCTSEGEHGRFSLLPNTQKYLWNLEQLSHPIRHPSSKHTWPKGTKRNITHLHWQPSEASIILQESKECTSPQDLTLPTKWKWMNEHYRSCCNPTYAAPSHYQNRMLCWAATNTVWIPSGDALRTNVSGPYHPWTQHCHVSCIVANLTSSVSEVTQLEPPFPELLEWPHSRVVQRDSGSLRFSSCMYFSQTSQSRVNNDRETVACYFLGLSSHY